jgi:hypothetical protein
MRRRTGNKVQNSIDQQYTEEVPQYLLDETELFLVNSLNQSNKKMITLKIPVIYQSYKFLEIAKKCGYEIIHTGSRNIEKDNKQVVVEKILVLKKKFTI